VEYRWLKKENIKPIPELLAHSADIMNRKTAICYEGRSISYKELFKKCIQLARFIKFHSYPGDRIAIFMPNIPQFIIAYYATLMAGRIAVPINIVSIGGELKKKRVTEIKITDEIRSQLVDTRPSIIFMADFLYPIFVQTEVDWPCVRVVASPKEWLPTIKKILYPFYARRRGRLVKNPSRCVSFTQALKVRFFIGNELNFSKISPNNIANLQPTGGTSGIWKMAMLTHKNLVVNCLQIRERFGDLLSYGKEIILGALPLCHSYGLAVCMNMTLLSLHGKLVLVPEFTPEKTAKLIKKNKITIFPGINRMYQAIVDKELSKTYFKSLKFFISGAGSISQNIRTGFKKLTGGALIMDGYGLSEASPVVSVTLPGDLVGLDGETGNLIGRPLPETKIKICDEKGNELPSGEAGEIVVSGDQIMIGYYNNPKETDEVFDGNGWLRTGDIGYTDHNGCLHFVDRLKDMIKVMGENVYPSRIEKELIKNPAISEAIVVGMPDPKMDETPVAVVVLKTKADDIYNSETDIMLRLKADSALGRYYLPSKIIIMDSLDEFKNIAGKIYKYKVKEFLLK